MKRTIGKILILLSVVLLIFPIYNSKVVVKKEQEQVIENFYNNFNVDTSEELEVVGVLYIPKIYLRIPIYKGVEEKAISEGSGVMESTMDFSLKDGTRPVITSHNGIPTRSLFIDLNKVDLGDEYYISTKDNIKKYIVNDITTLTPEEINNNGFLDPIAGKVLSTLLTCTPIGVNSHRLMVTGENVESTGELEDFGFSGAYFNTYEIVSIILAFLLFVLFLFLTINDIKNKSNQKEKLWRNF